MTMRHFTPNDLPVGMTTTAVSLPGDGRLYTFTHVELGVLGHLRITAYSSRQTLASAELAPGDPDAPDWERTFRLLEQVITI